MRSGDRASSTAARRMRSALVVLEATLAMVVLTIAALLAGSFVALNPTSPGFEIADRTKFSVHFAGARYEAGGARIAAVERIAEQLRALPGVTGVSAVTSLPLTGSTSVFPVRVASQPQESGRPPTIHFRAALPGYLTFMGMRILSGRDLAPSDTPAAQSVAVVNEAFAARMLHGKDPLASEIVIDEPDGPALRRIIGVVKDARVFGTDLRARPEVFVPYSQSPASQALFVIGARVPATEIASGIRRVMAAFDPALPVDRVQTLREVADGSVRPQRFFAFLMGAFAVVAMALAFIGLYAVAAWSVTQRTREIGVRIALGATPAAVSRMVLRYGFSVGMAGALAGSACALASAKMIEGYLYGVPARDPLVYATVGAAFVCIVTLASYMPARRAMRVDPMVALRAE